MIFLLCTACAKKSPQLTGDNNATVPRLQGIANVLTCMFEPNSEECARAKELNNQ